MKVGKKVQIQVLNFFLKVSFLAVEFLMKSLDIRTHWIHRVSSSCSLVTQKSRHICVDQNLSWVDTLVKNLEEGTF